MEIESNGKKRTIMKVSDNEFVIGGHAVYLKWSMREGPAKVEFHYGPILEEGKDFYGLGTIKNLRQVETNDPMTKSIRVALVQEDR